jgi:hypothetical protein
MHIDTRFYFQGLEFDTIFLWNFFSDSRADDEWMLVLSYLVGEEKGKNEAEEQALKSAYDEAKSRNDEEADYLRVLNFDQRKHHVSVSSDM